MLGFLAKIMAKGNILTVKESTIKVINQNEIDDSSLMDMTSVFTEGSGLIEKWITNKEHFGIFRRLGKNQQPKF